MKETGSDFADIVRHFQFDGRFLEGVPYGNGHIHDTYAVWFETAHGQKHRYLLQRMNHEVFKNPIFVMENIERITRHLRHKITAAGGDPQRETLNLIPAREGGFLYQSSTGSFWRAFIFIEDAQTYDTLDALSRVYQAASCFGNFQKMLADFPAEDLHETIPNFHHTPKRFEAFLRAVEQDSCNRACEVRDEINFIQTRASDTKVLMDLLEQGKLPLRTTHNDTKLNNVMIDNRTGRGLCLIDLDTVMPGLALYDFGDAIRAGAITAAEDEVDLSRVGLSLAVFEQMARGYLDSARDFLTPAEMEHLAFSAKLITLEQCIRFLTDYLNGDVYYRIHHPQHNLDRCRTQLKLVLEMEKNTDNMERIIEKCR
jgi:Phosphotransferase enzyme family